MTEQAPKRKRLARHTQKAKKNTAKPQVRNWKPDEKSININDVISAPEDLKGNYTGKIDKARRKHPWEQIATDYIEGTPVDPEDPESEREYPTLKDLGTAYGIELYLVKERSRKDQWFKKRQQFQIVEAQRRMSTRKFSVLGKSIDFDDNAHKASELGMKLIQVRLGEIAYEVKAKQQLREDALQKMVSGQDYKKSDLYSAVNSREMESLAKAMSSFQEIGMKALGTDVIRHEISGIDTNIFVDNSTTNNTQNNVSIQSEMQKDDPERLASILASLQDANLLPGIVDNMLEGETVDEEIGEIEAIPLIQDNDQDTAQTA